MARASGTPAVVEANRAGVKFELLEYEHDERATSWGMEAAERLGVDPARVFKTLVVTSGAEHFVALVPVRLQLDLKALARTVGAKKLNMVEPAVAERLTGYVVGGISPIGQRTRLVTVVDSSATDHATILVSAGRRGLDMELEPHDLVRLTGAELVAVSR